MKFLFSILQEYGAVCQSEGDSYDVGVLESIQTLICPSQYSVISSTKIYSNSFHKHLEIQHKGRKGELSVFNVKVNRPAPEVDVLCHLYYNWPGTVRVPAVCQYAHKVSSIISTLLSSLPTVKIGFCL